MIDLPFGPILLAQGDPCDPHIAVAGPVVVKLQRTPVRIVDAGRQERLGRSSRLRFIQRADVPIPSIGLAQFL